uniref:hypothetical protein n=1 Tax=Photorhabdus sp. RM322S TaxID=3342825 RepID=UPI0036DC03A7
MMNTESKVIPPMQVRIPSEIKEGIVKSAKKNMRTQQMEVLYRLKLIDEMEKKGEIEI